MPAGATRRNMKAFKIISNIIYAIGCTMVLVLMFICFFDSTMLYNPNAMLPLTLSEKAFFVLAFGAIPMLAACFAVYFSNRMHKQSKKILKLFAVFIPGIICLGCALCIIGVIMAGFIINPMLSYSS